MGWFPTTRNNDTGWRFDIVGLLAVIGESSIEEHVQVITAAQLSYAPRLIPAPQALLKTERPKRLPSIKNVDVVGVFSGIEVHELNYFANAIHDIEELKEYEFREYSIEYTSTAVSGKQMRVEDMTHRYAPDPKGANESTESDIERGPTRTNQPASAGSKVEERKIHVPMHFRSAINIVTIISVLMTIGLFVWAACINDGVACLAIVTISASTSLACLSSQWRPQLSERPSTAVVPDGDVVLRTRTGAMIVVHCSEEITREIYMATEKCDYVVTDKKIWSALVGTSTILLMVSVVLLGNCQWTMQAAIGVAYIILNGVYFILPFIAPGKEIWNMRSRFEIKRTYHNNAEGRNLALIEDHFGNRPSYTRTLAYAIKATGKIKWVTRGNFAPSTPEWNKWLSLAEENLNSEHWDAVKAKDDCMEEARRNQNQP